MTEAYYTGYEITNAEYKEDEDIVFADLTLSADIVEYSDDYTEASKYKDKINIRLKIEFLGDGLSRNCKMEDIMIKSSEDSDHFPYNQWLKYFLSKGELLDLVVD